MKKDLKKFLFFQTRLHLFLNLKKLFKFFSVSFKKKSYPQIFILKLKQKEFEPIVEQNIKTEITRISSKIKNLKQQISNFGKPQWLFDVEPFFRFLICTYTPSLDLEIGYIYPQVEEVSLSRCLFHSQSKFKIKIDSVLFNKDLDKYEIIKLISELFPQFKSEVIVLLFSVSCFVSSVL